MTELVSDTKQPCSWRKRVGAKENKVENTELLKQPLKILAFSLRS